MGTLGLRTMVRLRASVLLLLTSLRLGHEAGLVWLKGENLGITEK